MSRLSTGEGRDSVPSAQKETNPESGDVPGQTELAGEALQRRVAELLGYTNLRSFSFAAGDRINGLWGCRPGQTHHNRGTVPNFTSELNDIQRAESRTPALSRERALWSKNLRQILSDEIGIPNELHYTAIGDTDDLVHDLLAMSAEQRCRAFVKTMEEIRKR